MKFAENVLKILPHPQKTPEGKVMAFFSAFFLIFLAVSILIGFAVFGATMKGKKVVSVPSVKGMDLMDAMLELQNYGLVAEVHEKKTKAVIPRGTVFAQHPREGANVKMSAKVILSVSVGKGELILPDFTGRFLDEVTESVQRMNEQTGNPHFIELAINKIYNEAQPNEVLMQDLPPKTKIKEPSKLTLQVSLGKWEPTVSMPALLGVDFQKALSLLAEANIPFTFRTQKNSAARPGTVVAQTPDAEAAVPLASVVDVAVVPFPPQKGKIFQIHEFQLPRYATPLRLSVSVKRPKADETLFFSMKHPGGTLAFPYFEDEGTEFSLTVESEPVESFTVQ